MDDKREEVAGPLGSRVKREVGPLVEKLRATAREAGHYGAWGGGVLLEQAADEIERLGADAARQNKLMHLAAQDAVFFGGFLYDPDDREFRVPPPLVLCNDFFAPAADCEELPVDDIDALHDAYTRFGHAGVLAWVSLRREGANPWRLKPGSEFQERFRAARDALRPNAEFSGVPAGRTE